MKTKMTHAPDGHDCGADAEHCPTCREQFEGGTVYDALETLDIAQANIASAQGRANDANMDALSYQVKDALYIIKQDREDVIATLRGMVSRLRTLSTGELLAHQVASDLSGLIGRMEIGNAVGRPQEDR